MGSSTIASYSWPMANCRTDGAEWWWVFDGSGICMCLLVLGVTNLRAMVRYCQGGKVCRRALLAKALGEEYTPDLCQPQGCDVCQGRVRATTKDLTEETRSIIAFIR